MPRIASTNRLASGYFVHQNHRSRCFFLAISDAAIVDNKLGPTSSTVGKDGKKETKKKMSRVVRPTRNLTLTEELEKLEQSITLTLQGTPG